MTPWSYSGIKSFEDCPRRYYHERVAKDYKEGGESPALKFGNRVHKAAENFVMHGQPIPKSLAFMKPALKALRAVPGDKHPELELAVRKVEGGFEPCDYWDKNAWYRGKADLLVINDSDGILVDYKTGKSTRYADPRQLDLLAGVTFVRYPELKNLKSGLLYVMAKTLVPRQHTVDLTESYLNVFDTELRQLEVARQSDTWNPKPGGLCRVCPVDYCEHWEQKK
jgi:RecB family exonuclease